MNFLEPLSVMMLRGVDYQAQKSSSRVAGGDPVLVTVGWPLGGSVRLLGGNPGADPERGHPPHVQMHLTCFRPPSPR